MDAVSAAVGIVAAIPQCIEAAKSLYDLRTRYKDASVLITSIYSESMVIAASLQQIQILLQRDALQNRPELYAPFDQALIGCRVVYGCLEEGVRELAERAQDDNLRRRDRLKYLWKEDAFEEILKQIRGQQSALGLLIQGLQMESMMEIKELVQQNSAKLDAVTTGSNQLRRSHPTVRVPNSIFQTETEGKDLQDAHSILNSAEFSFDDEIVNSKAYRRALAQATLRSQEKDPPVAVEQGDLIDLDTPDEGKTQEEAVLGATQELKSLQLNDEIQDLLNDMSSPNKESADVATDEDPDILADLEQNLLPFMPPSFTGSSSQNEIPHKISHSPVAVSSGLSASPSPLKSGEVSGAAIKTTENDEEKPPPLPPRRSQSVPEKSPSPGISRQQSADETNSIFSTPSMLSKASTISSSTLFEPEVQDFFADSKTPESNTTPRLRTTPSTALFESLSYRSEDLVRVATLEDVEIHNLWKTLIASETLFLERIAKFRTAFYDAAIQRWPVLEKHLEAIVLSDQIASLHRKYILDPAMQQIEQKSFATANPAIFEAWATNAHKEYKNYAQRLPHAEGAIRTTQGMDKKFAPFINGLGLSISWFGKGWRDYLHLPMTHLDTYVTELEKFIQLAQRPDSSSSQTISGLKRALDIVQTLKTSCHNLIATARQREECHSLYRRIHTLDVSLLHRLGLLDPGRKIRLQSGMAIKVRGAGFWQPLHVVLLDNYLFFANVKPPKSWLASRPASIDAGYLWVLEEPVPLNDLEVTEAPVDKQFSKATILDDVPKGSVLYHIFVRRKSIDVKPHVMGAYSLDQRQEWLKHMREATAPMTGQPQ